MRAVQELCSAETPCCSPLRLTDANAGCCLHLQKNHLSGLKRRLLKLSFWNEQQLAEVKRDCFPLVRRNRHAPPPPDEPSGA
jgi:hypothetical protein